MVYGSMFQHQEPIRIVNHNNRIMYLCDYQAKSIEIDKYSKKSIGKRCLLGNLSSETCVISSNNETKNGVKNRILNYLGIGRKTEKIVKNEEIHKKIEYVCVDNIDYPDQNMNEALNIAYPVGPNDIIVGHAEKYVFVKFDSNTCTYIGI